MILKPFPKTNMSLVLSLITKEKKKIIEEILKKVRLQMDTTNMKMVQGLHIRMIMELSSVQGIQLLTHVNIQ